MGMNAVVEITYTLGERFTRTHEETSTDGTSNGDHVEVALLHGSVKLNDPETIVALFERREIEAISGHEVLIADGGSGILGPIVTTISREDRRRLCNGFFEVRAVRRLVLFAGLHGVDAETELDATFDLVTLLLCSGWGLAGAAAWLGLIPKIRNAARWGGTRK